MHVASVPLSTELQLISCCMCSAKLPSFQKAMEIVMKVNLTCIKDCKKRKEGGIIYVCEKLNIQTNASFSLLSQVYKISSYPGHVGKRQADFQELTVHVVSYTLMKIPLKIQQINLLTCCGVVPVAVLYKWDFSWHCSIPSVGWVSQDEAEYGSLMAIWVNHCVQY